MFHIGLIRIKSGSNFIYVNISNFSGALSKISGKAGIPASGSGFAHAKNTSLTNFVSSRGMDGVESSGFSVSVGNGRRSH